MLCLACSRLIDPGLFSSVLLDASTSFMLCVVFRALTTRQSRRNLPQYQSKCTNVLKVSDSKGFLNSSNQFVSSRTTIARDVARNYAGLDLEMGAQLRELVDMNVTEAQAAGVEGVAAAFCER